MHAPRKRRCGVFLPAPNGLHLDVPRPAQERRRLAIVQLHKRLRDRVLAPALRIPLGRLIEQPLKGRHQFRQRLAHLHFRRDLRRLGDDQPDAIDQTFPHGRQIARGPKPRNLLLNPSIRHRLQDTRSMRGRDKRRPVGSFGRVFRTGRRPGLAAYRVPRSWRPARRPMVSPGASSSRAIPYSSHGGQSRRGRQPSRCCGRLAASRPFRRRVSLRLCTSVASIPRRRDSAREHPPAVRQAAPRRCRPHRKGAVEVGVEGHLVRLVGTILPISEINLLKTRKIQKGRGKSVPTVEPCPER